MRFPLVPVCKTPVERILNVLSKSADGEYTQLLCVSEQWHRNKFGMIDEVNGELVINNFPGDGSNVIAVQSVMIPLRRTSYIVTDSVVVDGVDAVFALMFRYAEPDVSCAGLVTWASLLLE